jgi:hypothetical protein
MILWWYSRRLLLLLLLLQLALWQRAEEVAASSLGNQPEAAPVGTSGIPMPPTADHSSADTRAMLGGDGVAAAAEEEAVPDGVRPDRNILDGGGVVAGEPLVLRAHQDGDNGGGAVDPFQRHCWTAEESSYR